MDKADRETERIGLALEEMCRTQGWRLLVDRIDSWRTETWDAMADLPEKDITVRRVLSARKERKAYLRILDWVRESIKDGEKVREE